VRVLGRLTLIASDCRDWYSLSQQVEASEQWGKLDQAIAEATMPALKEAGLVPEKRHTSEQPTADSNYYLGEWINEMVDEGRKVAGMLRANKRIEDIPWSILCFVRRCWTRCRKETGTFFATMLVGR